ncbi:MAG: cytochrome C assembly protein, partial [Chloroflexi bacterium]|nr:cytochrome C assembly protein [Chloroflexota bacterium]
MAEQAKPMTGVAPATARVNRAETIRLALLLASGLLMLVNLALIFMWAPTERVMGQVQRIFYFHVPIAWVAFLAFTIVFVASILYLWKGHRRWDA